jgi:hypothetical protein
MSLLVYNVVDASHFFVVERMTLCLEEREDSAMSSVIITHHASSEGRVSVSQTNTSLPARDHS